MDQFDMDFETMNRVDVKSVCLTRLLIMGVLLGMNCTNICEETRDVILKYGLVIQHVKM